MGQKRFTHIRELQAKAATGNKTALAALDAALFVPHHLRRRNPFKGLKLVKGLHVTAKTHRGIACLQTETIPQDYGLDRLQMLKDRHHAAAA